MQYHYFFRPKEEKFHTDCRNAEVLAKTTTTTAQEGVVAAADTTPTPTTGNTRREYC